MIGLKKEKDVPTAPVDVDDVGGGGGIGGADVGGGGGGARYSVTGLYPGLP